MFKVYLDVYLMCYLAQDIKGSRKSPPPPPPENFPPRKSPPPGGIFRGGGGTFPDSDIKVWGNRDKKKLYIKDQSFCFF